MGECGGITRHQLFVHDDVPYTSHNSAMCFTAEIYAHEIYDIIDLGRHLLKSKSAEGSDPGLCVAIVDSALDYESLVNFGFRAKKEVLNKQGAYALAQRLGVHLTEHGSTGDGIIGALAGVGLRLQGSDGRFRGWLKDCTSGEAVTAGELVAKRGADFAMNEERIPLAADAKIICGMEKVKTILWKGRRTIPVVKAASGGVQALWATLTKEQVKRY